MDHRLGSSPVRSLPARVTARLAVLVAGALAATALAVAGAPSAQAAWGTHFQVHGGKTQLCKAPRADGRWQIRVRLDNRGARHAHIAGLSRVRDFEVVASVAVRAGAGRISETRSMVWDPAWSRHSHISAGIGETTGEGLGSDVGLGQIVRC